MYVIGTAGHVDHGKSTLIKNLTNIDPDRLIEEKKRKMTIELGFAWFNDSNNTIGIIDVPGHEELVDNMIKGVFGIDMALLVISASESVKEQTVEHLEILRISNTKKILVVLTKKDLVSKEILDKHIKESQSLIKRNGFDDANIICVNSHDLDDIEKLRKLIIKELATLSPEDQNDYSRMYVDRVFHKKGHGTIVTGTLINGYFKLNQDIYIDGLYKSKIRSMESYENSIDIAKSKVRLAINLSNVNHSDISRGSILTNTDKNVLEKSVIAKIKLVDSYTKSLKHNSVVEVYIGSSQTKGRLIFYKSKVLKNPDEIYVLIKFHDKIHYRILDRLILRSSGTTIAGGKILSPGQSVNLFKSETYFQYLEYMSENRIEDSIIQLLMIKNILDLNTLKNYLSLNNVCLKKIINSIKDKLIIIKHGNSDYKLLDKNWHKQKLKSLMQILKDHKLKYPLRSGMNKNEVSQKLYPQLDIRTSDLLIENLLQTKYIEKHNDILMISEEEQNILPNEIKLVIDHIQNSKDIIIEQNLYDRETLAFLIKNLYIINLSRTIYVNRQWFEKSKEIILKHFNHNDKLDIQTTKKLLNTSRKLTVAFLEKLDSDNITRRLDNQRILIK